MPLLELPHRLIQAVRKKTLLHHWPRVVFASSNSLIPVKAKLPLNLLSSVVTELLSSQASGLPTSHPDSSPDPNRLLLFHHWPVQISCPDDWRLDPLSQLHWPGADTPFHNIDYRAPRQFGDVKFVWEIGRFPHLLPLARQARLTQNLPLARLLLKQITQFTQTQRPGYGIHWTSAIEMAWRAWTFQIALEILDPFFNSTDPDRLAAWSGHLAHSVHGAEFAEAFLSLHSSANNHLIAEAALLEFIGTLIHRAPELFSPATQVCGKRWLRLGRSILDREIPRQILPHGSGIEHAPAYLVQVLEWAELIMALRTAASSPAAESAPPWTERVAAALGWIQHLAAGEGERLPHLGDCDDGSLLWSDAPYSPAHLEGLVRFGRALDLRPQSSFVELDQADFSPRIMRTDRLRLTFETSPHGQPPLYAHAHNDALAVTADYQGKPVLIDPGTYLYHAPGPWRDAFRATAAHNTLQVGEQEQVPMLGPFLFDHPSYKIRLENSPDPSRETASLTDTRGWTWTRSVFITQEPRSVGRLEWSVQDRLFYPSAKTKVPVGLTWNFAPGHLEIQGFSGQWSAAEGGLQLNWNIVVAPACEVHLSVHEGEEPSEDMGRLPRGWFSPHFGLKTESPTLRLEFPQGLKGDVLSEFSLITSPVWFCDK
jgi:hypothetical protein